MGGCAFVLRSIITVRWGYLHLKVLLDHNEAGWNRMPRRYMTLEHGVEWSPCFTGILRSSQHWFQSAFKYHAGNVDRRYNPHTDECAQAAESISTFMPGLETQSNKCNGKRRRRRRRKQKLILSRCFLSFSGRAALGSAEAAVSWRGRAMLRSRAGRITRAEVIFQTLEWSFPRQSWGDARPLSVPSRLSPWHPGSCCPGCWHMWEGGGGWRSTHLLQWINLPPVSRPRLQSGFNSTIIELTECVIRCFTETRMFGCKAPQCRLIQSTTNGKHREALFSALNFQIVLNTQYMHKPDPETCAAYAVFYEPWMVKCLLKFLSSLKCMGSTMHAVWERGCSYFLFLYILKDSGYVSCFHETM